MTTTLSPPTTDAPPLSPALPATAGLGSLRRLWPWVRPAAGRMAIAAVCAILGALCGLAFPIVIVWIVNGPIARHSLSSLWWPGAVLLLLGVLESSLFYVRRMLVARPITRVEAEMRAAIYAHLQRLPVSFHDRWPAGQLLSRAMSDLSTVRRFLAFGLIFLFVNLVTVLVGLVVLLVMAPLLGLIVTACALPLVGVCVWFESRYRVLARRSQDQVGDLATTVEESILGIRILKAFGRSAHLSLQFRRQALDLRATELGKATVIAWLWPAVIVLPEIALGLALLLGVVQVAHGSLSAGTLVGFFGVAMGLRWPVESIGWLLAQANDTASASQRFFEVMDTPVTLRSPENPITPTDRLGHLQFRDVRFRFGDGDRDLLTGFDLDLHPGETVALVGATGSGKTLVTSLVNRLYDVTGGRILLDGVDVRDLDLAALRSRVSVAFEEPTLFSASVRENILLGRPGSEADVERAIEVAQAHFVDDLPWGLDTRIGEQGLSLSGGQRQRLALARAVLGGPEVLVLDDPLSALDIHTEAEVERALRSALAGTTALVVAHRASTVLLADRVAMLAGGRVVASGTHTELLASTPAYRALLSSEDQS